MSLQLFGLAFLLASLLPAYVLRVLISGLALSTGFAERVWVGARYIHMRLINKFVPIQSLINVRRATCEKIYKKKYQAN
jgi:hypothetical protein